MTKEQARFKKLGYMRAARISKKMSCSLRKHDVLRALHYRDLQKNAFVSNIHADATLMTFHTVSAVGAARGCG